MAIESIYIMIELRCIRKNRDEKSYTYLQTNKI